MFYAEFSGSDVQIVIVCDFGVVNGGAARVAIDSARGLAEAGMAVTYICAIPPVSALLEHPNIDVRCLDFGSVWTRRNPLAAASQGIWNRSARRAIETILDALPRGQTVVHFHQWTKAFSPSVLSAGLRRGLPSVVSLHDYFITCPTGNYFNFPRGVPCTLTPMSLSCMTANCDSRSYVHKLVRVLRQFATRKAVADAGASLSIVSMSPFAERVIDQFIPKLHARYVVRSPIQIARGEPVPVAENTDFLFIGRLTNEKGVKFVAEAARDAGLPLTIVGDGPLLGELKAFGGTVTCTGWLGEAEVAALARRARALIFPSRWYETGGLVVLEALAQGIPVIASRTTAPVDFIAEGESGFIVDSGDRQALLDRMCRLRDNAVAQRMGQEAYRRYWAKPQTIGVHTDALLEVYRSVLAEHERQHASHPSGEFR